MAASPDRVEDATPPVASKHPRSRDVNLRAPVQMREYLEIAQRIARMSPGAVLDWGCGQGQLTWLLREREVDVTAFDWNPEASLEGELAPIDRFPGLAAYHSSDPVKLPFPDASFECVLSCGVLEHVQRPDDSLEELRRVLRPGGRLLVYKLPNRFSYLEAVARRAGFYYHGAMPHDRVYTRRTAVALIEEHGFRIDAFHRTNLLPLTVTWRPARALAGPMWAVNRALGHVPVLRLLATNLELDATAR